MKKKKLIIISIIILLIVLLFVGIFVFYKKTEGATKCNQKDTLFDLYYDEEKTSNSKQFSKADIFSELSYKEIHLANNYPKLQLLIDKLNKESKERYNEITNESNKVSQSNCPEISEDYRYRIQKNSIISLGETTKYYSINVIKTKIDLCTDNENTVEAMDNYIFDKKLNDFITQEEFMKKENLTDKIIEEKIEKTLKQWSTIDNINYVYNPIYNGKKSYTLYIHEDGYITAMYYAPELKGYVEIWLE